MNHNLFTKPTEYTIKVNDSGYEIMNECESKSLLNILDTIGYKQDEILNKLESDLLNSYFITEKEKSDTLIQLRLFFKQNGYLRTTT